LIYINGPNADTAAIARALAEPPTEAADQIPQTKKGAEANTPSAPSFTE
jgi:hypothetical protein